MGLVSVQFFQHVLAGIGAPATGENLRACWCWQAAEGGTAAYNPWNTTQPASGATAYNTAGVRNFPNDRVGIVATVDTLTNGRYGQIVRAFQAGDDGLAVCEAVDRSVWGTTGAERVYRYRYHDTLVPPRLLQLHDPYQHGSDVRTVQEALIRHGVGVGPSGPDGIYGPATAQAVMVFQRERHIGVDGIVGRVTLHALGLPL